MSWTRIGKILRPIDDTDRFQVAMRMYKEAPMLSEVTQTVSDEWKVVFDQNRGELARLRQENREIDERYQRFVTGNYGAF